MRIVYPSQPRRAKTWTLVRVDHSPPLYRFRPSPAKLKDLVKKVGKRNLVVVRRKKWSNLYFADEGHALLYGLGTRNTSFP